MLKNLNKGVAIPITIGIILLVAILAGGIFAWQYQKLVKESEFPETEAPAEVLPPSLPEEELPERIIPAEEVADWETYRNDYYSFEFKIPPLFVANGYRIIVEDKEALSEKYHEPINEIDMQARVTFEMGPIAPHYATVSEDERQGMFYIFIYPQEYCQKEGKELCSKIRTGEERFKIYLTENEKYLFCYNTGGTSGRDVWSAMGWEKDEVKENFYQMLSTFQVLE